jgi:hypothetical protein
MQVQSLSLPYSFSVELPNAKVQWGKPAADLDVGGTWSIFFNGRCISDHAFARRLDTCSIPFMQRSRTRQRQELSLGSLM